MKRKLEQQMFSNYKSLLRQKWQQLTWDDAMRENFESQYLEEILENMESLSRDEDRLNYLLRETETLLRRQEESYSEDSGKE